MRSTHGDDRPASRGRRRKASPRTDATEQALRRWLVQRHYRVGDRLPADTDLAQMLGVARSTVISALDRLEEAGMIVRRQGSGTFVCESPLPAGIETGLEVLGAAGGGGGSWTDSAMRLARAEVTRPAAAPEDVAEALRIAPGTAVTRIRRVVASQGRACALLVDHVAPTVALDEPDEVTPRLTAGHTVLDELLGAGLPVAYARTAIRPVTVTPEDEAGRTLGLTEATAALEVTEVTYVASGEPVKHSVDLVLECAWQLTVLRQLGTGHADTPTPLPPRAAAMVGV